MNNLTAADLEALRIQKIAELRKIEEDIVNKSLLEYSEKLAFIKDFIITHGPRIDLNMVDTDDRILYDENYNYDDYCNPLYADFIKVIFVDDDDYRYYWDDKTMEINHRCIIELSCNYLTDNSQDYDVHMKYLRNKTEYKGYTTVLKLFNNYDNFDNINQVNADAIELIDVIYNFIKKYPAAFKPCNHES